MGSVLRLRTQIPLMDASQRRTAEGHTPADLLWLSSETPDVNGGGGQRRQYHQIATLVHNGITVVVATVAGPQDDTSVRRLAPVYRFEARRIRRRKRDLETVIKNTAPSRALVAHVESVRQVLPELERARVPFLVDFHNVLSRWHVSVGEERVAARWRDLERNALATAGLATTCSVEEREALVGLGTDTAVDVSPHGVDPQEWPSSYLRQRREPAIALFGSWDHGPNRSAVEWLGDNVWPLVRATLPNARLLLLGPGRPPASLLAQSGVEAHGRIASLAEALGRVRVAVIPIRRGMGARMKFVESLASGAAVVSTSEGAEGFDADGAFVRADDADAFAHACIQLLRDDERAMELGRRGRELALTRLTWDRTSAPIVSWAKGMTQ
jgi:polysaccharide biosynthesis protein PslH